MESAADPLSVLESLRSILAVKTESPLNREIEEEIRKLRANRFHLAVVGQFKRGKSTLINALLGEQLLPVGVLPLTAVITIITYDLRERIEVFLEDGSTVTIDKPSLADYVTEEGNPNNRRKVALVNITHPSPTLKDGVVLIDTPGIGSLFSHNTKTTREFVPRVDAAVFVLSADPPMTQTEYDFLDELLHQVGKVFIILNKVDTLTKEEVGQTVEYTKRAVFPMLRSAAVYPVSALNALRAKLNGDEDLLVESGVANFARSLDEFMRIGKRDVLLNRSAQRISSFVARANFQFELERKAFQMPLDLLESLIDEFDKKMDDLQHEALQLRFVLEGELKALEQRIHIELREFAAKESDFLRRKVQSWGREHLGHSYDEYFVPLEGRLASELVSDFDQWRTIWEPELVRIYTGIANRASKQLSELLNRMIVWTSKAFKIEAQPFEKIETLAWKDTFYYKIQDYPVFMEIDGFKMFARALSSTFVRKQLLKRLINSVETKVDRNCGRLTYEYLYSIQEAQRGFERHLDQTTEGFVLELRQALKYAVDEHSKIKKDRAPIIHLLEETLSTLRNLQEQSKVAS